jgi:hypothetical protein
MLNKQSEYDNLVSNDPVASSRSTTRVLLDYSNADRYIFLKRLGTNDFLPALHPNVYLLGLQILCFKCVTHSTHHFFLSKAPARARARRGVHHQFEEAIEIILHITTLGSCQNRSTTAGGKKYVNDPHDRAGIYLMIPVRANYA